MQVWVRTAQACTEQAWRTAGSWVLAIGRSHVGDWRCSKSLLPHPAHSPEVEAISVGRWWLHSWPCRHENSGPTKKLPSCWLVDTRHAKANTHARVCRAGLMEQQQALDIQLICLGVTHDHRAAAGPPQRLHQRLGHALQIL